MGKAKTQAAAAENTMKLDVKITALLDGDNPVATASVNMNDCFAVKNIKVMNGKNGLFISMPSYKTKGGEYKDICFPITKEFREQLNSAVVNAYEQALDEKMEHSEGLDGILPPGM